MIVQDTRQQGRSQNVNGEGGGGGGGSILVYSCYAPRIDLKRDSSRRILTFRATAFLFDQTQAHTIQHTATRI